MDFFLMSDVVGTCIINLLSEKTRITLTLRLCSGQWQDYLIQKATGVTDHVLHRMAHLKAWESGGASNPEAFLEPGASYNMKA